jgi:hypothetical protein
MKDEEDRLLEMNPTQHPKEAAAAAAGAAEQTQQENHKKASVRTMPYCVVVCLKNR